MKKRISSMILAVFMVVSLLPSVALAAKAIAPTMTPRYALEPSTCYHFKANGDELKQDGSNERAYIQYLLYKSSLQPREQALWEAGKVTASWETEVWTGISWSWYSTYLCYSSNSQSYRFYSDVTPAATVNTSSNGSFNLYENKGTWQKHNVTAAVPYNVSSVGGFIMQPPNHDAEWGNRDYGWRNQNAVWKYKNQGTNTYLKISFGNDSAYPLEKPTATEIISGQTLSASTLSGGKATAYGAYTNMGNSASDIQGTYKWYDSNTRMLSSGAARINYDPIWTNFSTTQFFESAVQTVDVPVRAAAITLDKVGGSGGSASAEGWYGSNLSDITVPTLLNYKFAGYYSAAFGGTQYYDATGKSVRNWDIADDTTLYAHWEEANYTATVTVNKDGNAWSGSGKSLALFQSGTKKYDLTLSGSTANVSALAGTYDIFDGASDTGLDIAVSSGGGNSATVNYYSLTLSAGTGTSSPTGGGNYLPGKSVPINATVSPGYLWSKWQSSDTALLPDKITQNTNVSMPGGAVTLTATTTLVDYTITYQINGGTVATANPANYTVNTTAFALNNPTRTGYSFVGWSGTGLTGNTNKTVTISANSTGAKSYTANWKADAPSSAPLASIVTPKTDTSFTITTQTGYEYSVDGTNWYSGNGSYTFTGLTAGTNYNLVCRKAEVSTGGSASAASDASPALTVTTKKAGPATPTLAFDSITASGVTIKAVTGAQYSKDNGTTWHDENAFIGLTPATSYSFAIRLKETADTMPSATASKTQYTAAAAPLADTGYSINYTTEKITVNSGYEVSTDKGFGSGTFIGNNEKLTPSTTYYIRVVESGGVPESEAVSFAIPARPVTPTDITAVKTKNSITITPVAGQEYKIGNGNWQDSGTFEGLSANTDYTVFARVKAVSSGSVSFASEVYLTTVKTKWDGSSGFSLSTISEPPTYAPGKTLNDIKLLPGWTWSAPTTVPTVTNSGYSAVYTPTETETETVDYSGVDGYALVGGKVTITKTIPLTVSRATPTAADFTYTAPASLPYSGTGKSATVAAKSDISGMGIITLKYYDEDGAMVDAPTDAGNYTVKISVAQGENYAAVTELTDKAWAFTIDQVAQAPLSITGKPDSVTYGDTFNLSTTGGSSTGAVTWAVTKGDSATVNESNGAITVTGVGETTITATKAKDGNHTEAVTDTYTFTPAKRQLTLTPPSATGGFTKSYDATNAFNTASVLVGTIANKVGADTVTVAVQSASYDAAAVGAGDKELTITYCVEGKDSGKYLAPTNTVISNASITAATPTIKLEKKIVARTDKIIEIDAATVAGVGSDGDISKNYSGAITYTYYTKEACADADRTKTEQTGAQTIGGAPKESGTYYVKATIAAKGNYTNASSAPVTLTIYRPSSGGGTPAIAENNSSSPVIVDGKVVEIGKSEVKGSTTTVKVDQNKLTKQIKNAKDSVFIPITAKTDTATAQLVVQNVEDMAAQKMALTVQSGKVSYHLDTAAIDTKALASAFSGTDTKLIPFQVTIAKSPVKVEGANIIVPPVEFTITASYGGKTVEVDTFKSFINRTIEISAEQAKKITTAVVVEKDGTLRHVPTNVMQKNGKYYAVINSLTNSTYTLIENEVKFVDASGKWYEKAVNEMGSRKTIGGIGDNRFAGETSVTRAEFAAILVRALGLPTDSTAASVFADVSSSKWYYGAVGTAYAYDLVSGKRENQFDPNANITRQEAMAMIARAAKVANYTGSTSSLVDFSDADKLGAWAVDSAKFNVGAGLIIGNNANLRPQDQISRAETATVILRLLQKAELVDVRN